MVQIITNTQYVLVSLMVVVSNEIRKDDAIEIAAIPRFR